MRRREFIAGLGGAAASWPLAARAQQRALPVVALLRAGAIGSAAEDDSAFPKGLTETGYVEAQNVTIESHWLNGQYDRLPSLVADLLARRIAVIAQRLGLVAPPRRLSLKPPGARSPSSSGSEMITSSLGWSRALPDRVAM
jgi:putative ABC transport system substrate-binding protein